MAAKVQGESAQGQPIRVAIIGFTDLKTGAGTETTILNYVKHAPTAGFSTVVVDTDHVGNHGVALLTDDAVASKLNGVQHVRIRDYLHKFDFIQRVGLFRVVQVLVVQPVLFTVIGRVLSRKTFDWLSRFDVVLLILNDYAYCFPTRRRGRGALLIGTSHCFRPSRLSLAGLLIAPMSWVRRIDGLQIFRSDEGILDLLERGPVTFELPSGVDSTLFAPRDSSLNYKVRILFVGRLIPEKGVLRVVSAWERMTHHGETELHLVGAGPLAPRLQAYHADGYFFHGSVSEEDLVKIYRSSDVFVYPSSVDTFALVVLQALSSGLYCLISQGLSGIYDEFVKNGFAEYVDPRGIIEMSSKLDRIVAMKENYLSKSKESHELAARNFDWSVVTARLYQNLSRLVNTSN